VKDITPAATALVPRVSICLPNLNNRAYLDERLDTILRQTFSDWELIIYDNYSDDGAWELFQELAATDQRVRLERAPRQGMYENWNNCIRAARGEYVYIATSDDTMAEDCLEKMVAALDANRDCDLAHCTLREIDEGGREWHDWWRWGSVFALSSGGLVHQPHIRRAPLDGLLHLCGNSVYTSITQLLIRRSLFSRAGMFRSDWGSIGDVNWDMRAGLIANTVHVPGTWASWRKHSAQATAEARLGHIDHPRKTDEMIDHALAATKEQLPAQIRSSLRKWTRRMRDLRYLHLEIHARPGVWSRRMFLARRVLSGSWAARRHIRVKMKGDRTVGEAAVKLILDWLNQVSAEPLLVPLGRSAEKSHSHGLLPETADAATSPL
jgi:Glycosyl transferase family 2